MRTTHWTFVVSVLLFVSGVAFTIAAARVARRAPAIVPTIDAPPVASVKQIMKGITGPAAGAIFNAVSTTVTKNGVEEVAPHTEAEWEALGDQAAALVESGNLLLMGSRVVDKGDWVKMTRSMIDAGNLTLQAVRAKSPDKVFDAGEIVNQSCDACHGKYQRGS
jgi:hypothetical protein